MCVLVPLVVLAFIASCGSDRVDTDGTQAAGEQPSTKQTAGTNADGSVFVNQVPFCWSPPASASEARVQVLLDASGSMVGFEDEVPRIVDWVRKGVSQLRGLTISIPEGGFRTAQFDQSHGIHRSTGWNEPMASFSAQGNTNLHAAIQQASDRDLTFVLTDGVAATAVGGSGECPGGVDASCVAKALRNVTHGAGQSGKRGGLWVLPLVTQYSGKYYTEQYPPSGKFSAGQVVDRVESEIGGDVVVQNIGTSSSGRMTFNYRGPRSLALFVLANDIEIGRAAVHALWQNAPISDLRQIESLNNASSATPNVVRPIEVYPGFVNEVEWEELAKVKDGILHKGPMKTELLTDKNTQIRMKCLPGKAAQGAYHLRGRRKKEGGCTRFHVLPAFSFEMQSVGGANGHLKTALQDYRRAEKSLYSDLRVTLSCPATGSLPSCENPVQARWVADTDYQEGANCLSNGGCAQAQHQLLRSMSTTSPRTEPHRIFGFDRTMELFYREMGKDKRRLMLGRLELCSVDPQHSD